MAFTRKFLRQIAKDSGVELPKELEDAIIQEHTDSRDAYTESQVSELEETIKELKSKNTDINVKETDDYKALQKELEDFKNNVESEKTNSTKLSQLTEKLEEAGANKTAIKLLIKEFDLNKVEIVDGKIKDIDTLVKPVQESYKDFFGKTETSGVDTGNPPGGDSGKTFTIEQIKAMSTDEINKNWDAVSKTLEGGN